MPQNNIENVYSQGLNAQKDQTASEVVENVHISVSETSALHNVSMASSDDRAPTAEIKQTIEKKKRWSFGGGANGQGRPLFANLEASKGKHRYEGYEDIKPPDGYFGAAFKRYVSGRTAK
ncbi:hypothetical protein RUND412_003135 [Rhizina undulata]